jgi:Gas vesicle synthesis protein GvpL/GvpF
VTTSVDSWCYVFGIVPAATPLPASGGDGPAADLRLVEFGDLAAVVGTPPHRSLGRAADLLAHDRVLGDLVTQGAAVLPMRFGAVMTDEAAVARELLDAHHDEFTAGLATVRGRVQYTLKVRYEQDAVLRQVLAEHPEIARLREATQRGDRGTFQRQLQLGELVVLALEQLRPADAATVMAELGDQPQCRLHETSSPDDVLEAAFLIEADGRADFEQQVEDVARRHAGRLRLRLVGPSPAYDFVREV